MVSTRSKRVELPPPHIADWRTQLQPASRSRIVNKIMETLTRCLPILGPEGLIELQKIAVRFEEKMYNTGTSQTDYLRRISLKMLTMEVKSQSTSRPNSSQPSSAAGNLNPSGICISDLSAPFLMCLQHMFSAFPLYLHLTFLMVIWFNGFCSSEYFLDTMYPFCSLVCVGPLNFYFLFF